MVDWVEMRGGAVPDFSRSRTNESRAGHGPLTGPEQKKAVHMKAAALNLWKVGQLTELLPGNLQLGLGII
jgi:hypothetical protein